ncbi:MAG TPA: TraB/GumN family protein [Verrucomicrobiae bacterium]|nr:TraB/GumN family protein [Verrucomicrobiae bacterium]
MKRQRVKGFHLLLLVPVLLPPLLAQQPSTNGQRHQPMWKVAGERATVYLLGSVHLLKKEHYPLAAPIEAAFEKAKVAVFEIDFEEAENPTTRTNLLAKTKLGTGETLRDLLSKRSYERLTNYLESIELPLQTVENLKVGVIAMSILYLEAQRLGFEEKLGVDRHLQERARKDGKKILALDTPESQMDVFTGLSKQDGETLLNDTIDLLDMMDRKLEQAISAWKTGDIATAAVYLNDWVTKHPELYQRFAVERNRRWIPKIEKLVHGNQDAIVVVGALHLAGKQNLLEMLEQKGVKVTQE